MSGEFALIDRLRRIVPAAPPGETWIGDDAAVVAVPTGPLLVAADVLVEGVHFDLALSSLADVGWKAVAVNVSDIAAMGGRPLHLLVTVMGPPGTDVDALYEGIAAAARAWGCGVVGGDLANGPLLAVSVSVTGTTDGRPAVLRSGARPGDAIFVTGPLGGAAAELRAIRAGAALGHDEGARHRTPLALVGAGRAAALAGATAMIDVSDGLVADLGHVATTSGVGVALVAVPVHPEATPADALYGGDDYELVFTAPDEAPVLAAFEAAGLEPPERLGICVTDAAVRTLGGAPLEPGGWEHDFA